MSGNVRINTEYKPLIILGGPTGIGKSDITLKVALALKGEIISADSVAVYRGLDIGSAKPSDEMMRTVPHHLVNILDPDDRFGVDEFVRLAKDAMEQIWSRGHLPFITGGTGFYIQALLYDIDFDDEEADDGCRDRLYAEASADGGPDILYERLKNIDPEYALSVHPNNVKRVIRALEYNIHTGRLFSELNRIQREYVSPYRFCYYALNADRAILYDRIDKRVDHMIDSGLVEEVRGLLDKGYDPSLNSLSSIGYKETVEYIKGGYDLEHMKAEIKKNSRHLAKRQLTWLRREKDIRYITRDMSDKSDEDRIADTIIKEAAEKGLYGTEEYIS